MGGGWGWGKGRWPRKAAWGAVGQAHLGIRDPGETRGSSEGLGGEGWRGPKGGSLGEDSGKEHFCPVGRLQDRKRPTPGLNEARGKLKRQGVDGNEPRQRRDRETDTERVRERGLGRGGEAKSDREREGEKGNEQPVWTWRQRGGDRETVRRTRDRDRDDGAREPAPPPSQARWGEVEPQTSAGEWE